MKSFTLYSTKYKKTGFKSSAREDATFHRRETQIPKSHYRQEKNFMVWFVKGCREIQKQESKRIKFFYHQGKWEDSWVCREEQSLCCAWTGKQIDGCWADCVVDKYEATVPDVSEKDFKGFVEKFSWYWIKHESLDNSVKDNLFNKLFRDWCQGEKWGTRECELTVHIFFCATCEKLFWMGRILLLKASVKMLGSCWK